MLPYTYIALFSTATIDERATMLPYTYIACLIRLLLFFFVCCLFFLYFCAVSNWHAGCLARTLNKRKKWIKCRAGIFMAVQVTRIRVGRPKNRSSAPDFPFSCVQTESEVHPILGAFAKLRKRTISFAMSARPSICPHLRTRLPLDGFSWSLMYAYSSKNCRENSRFI